MLALKRIFLGIILCLSLTAVVAGEQSPVNTLKKIADNVVNDLQKNKDDLKKKPNLVFGIVHKNLDGHIDIKGMSRSVLGREVWNEASYSQREEFRKVFASLVSRTYSGALTNYTDETVEFKPLRENYENKRRLKIYSTIVRKRGPNIPLNYRVIRKGDTWKIYDLSVEGVSLLQSFRAQFKRELRHGSLNDLIHKLSILQKKAA